MKHDFVYTAIGKCVYVHMVNVYVYIVGTLLSQLNSAEVHL